MYELSRMRLNYILRYGSPDIKHKLAKLLEELIAEAKIKASENVERKPTWKR